MFYGKQEDPLAPKEHKMPYETQKTRCGVGTYETEPAWCERICPYRGHISYVFLSF
jgi:hypothetical protein